jgi:hypothetical protein
MYTFVFPRGNVKLPFLHVTTNIHSAITKLLSFMSPKHSDCNSNCSKATQTCKIPPSYVHRRANFIQGEEICTGRMTDKIRNLYQIIMAKMSTINDMIMTGNLFPIFSQCNIYKLSLYMEQDASSTIETGVTESIINFLSTLCTYINQRMNIYTYIYKYSTEIISTLNCLHNLVQ